MGEIDYSKRRIHDASERLSASQFAALTDAKIEQLVEDIYQARGNISLSLPLLPETIKFFWSIFHCRRCGDCCTGPNLPPGHGIIVNPEEVERLAYAKSVAKSRFKDEFTFTTREGARLMRYPCPFHDSSSHSCTIYDRRPMVCRTYPINNPLIPKGLHRSIDGAYIMTVNSLCPEGREIAVRFLKMKRNLLASTTHEELQRLRTQGNAYWSQLRRQQSYLYSIRKGDK